MIKWLERCLAVEQSNIPCGLEVVEEAYADNSDSALNADGWLRSAGQYHRQSPVADGRNYEFSRIGAPSHLCG